MSILGSVFRDVLNRTSNKPSPADIHCPFCGARPGVFLPFGLPLPVLNELHVVGGGYRLNALCQSCQSLDRERLVYLYLLQRSGLFERAVTILHVAPEGNLQKALLARPHLNYISADFISPRAAVRLDIVALPLKTDSIDVVICNHVLEHVPDDRRAMAELYRVLKPGGWAILQVPIALKLTLTYEDLSIVTPVERERAFGQHDHVRIYGQDYPQRLAGAGFSVQVLSPAEALGEGAIRQYGLNAEEALYLATKPRVSVHPARAYVSSWIARILSLKNS